MRKNNKKSIKNQEEGKKLNKIIMENKLSRITEKDVSIILEPFVGDREPDHTLEVDGINFSIHDMDASVWFAYPDKPEKFEQKKPFKLNGRCIETLRYIKRTGKEDGFHQFERDELDREGFIDFKFPEFKYFLTEKGEEALSNYQDLEIESP